MYIYYLHKIFYSFENIFVSFCPENMILGAFWRVIIGLQKTSLNWQDWSTITSLFAVLESQKWKTKTAGPVFCSLGPVQLQSFFSLGTGLPSTSIILVVGKGCGWWWSLEMVVVWVVSARCCGWWWWLRNRVVVAWHWQDKKMQYSHLHKSLNTSFFFVSSCVDFPAAKQMVIG